MPTMLHVNPPTQVLPPVRPRLPHVQCQLWPLINSAQAAGAAAPPLLPALRTQFFPLAYDHHRFAFSRNIARERSRLIKLVEEERELPKMRIQMPSDLA